MIIFYTYPHNKKRPRTGRSFSEWLAITYRINRVDNANRIVNSGVEIAPAVICRIAGEAIDIDVAHLENFRMLE